jgi:hypothetical protein
MWGTKTTTIPMAIGARGLLKKKNGEKRLQNTWKHHHPRISEKSSPWNSIHTTKSAANQVGTAIYPLLSYDHWLDPNLHNLKKK